MLEYEGWGRCILGEELSRLSTCCSVQQPVVDRWRGERGRCRSVSPLDFLLSVHIPEDERSHALFFLIRSVTCTKLR